VQLHPDDARARGIADGDVVRIFNDRGGCLAGAVLTDAIRPGVARLPTGAWYDPVPAGPVPAGAGTGQVSDGTGPPLCAHGNPNVLTADVPSSRLSQGCTGQHALVEIERYQGEPPPVTVGSPPPLLRGRASRTGTRQAE
jgi:biotin/methionine sulfoxide reductase